MQRAEDTTLKLQQKEELVDQLHAQLVHNSIAKDQQIQQLTGEFQAKLEQEHCKARNNGLLSIMAISWNRNTVKK
jgi:hypothetical protein